MNIEKDFSIVVRTEFNNSIANSIIDSGAGVSVMDLGTFESLKLTEEIKTSQSTLRDASGNAMNILGVAKIRVHVIGTDKIFDQDFNILNDRSYRSVIMGRDLMRKFRSVTFDFENDVIFLDGQKIKGLSAPNRKVTVRSTTDLSVPARTEQILHVFGARDVGLVTSDFQPKRFTDRRKLYTSKALVNPNVEGSFYVTVVNTSNKALTIKKRQILGYLQKPDEIVAKINIEDIVNKSDIDLELIETAKRSTNLTPDQQKRLHDLLSEYKMIFASNPKNPSRTELLEHRIITNTERPIYIKPRRIPLAWEKDVNSQIEEMLKNKVIRPSKSPWNAPILLVKKKDNSTRFVCDFRGLNDITKKDTYPLPQVKDVIDKMLGMKYWTTLDAASAYWSIPMCEDDKEKTAFSVPRGKYEFEVMTYGLCNAGASYQRLINMVLSGLPPDRVLAYIDDVVIFSRTFDEHICLLGRVFQAMATSGISLKLSKCVFAAPRVDYLGYVLSCDGVKPQSRLTEAIENFATPNTKKEVRRFLGMAGFYRDFISNFSEIASPLNNLTKENVVFHWSTECNIAFITLKQALISAPVLAFPDPNQEFLVEVDASKNAVGGVLSQYQGDQSIHPVAYYSTSLTEAQKNWSPYTLEAYAIVMAVRHWDTYLAGSKFTIFSDHNPLVSLQKKKNPKGKLARWISELEGYNFTVKYVTGKSNEKADSLSRNRDAHKNFVPEDTTDVSIYNIYSDELFKQQLRKEQDSDTVIATAKNNIRNGLEISQSQLKRVCKQLRIEDGILTKNGRPVVPPSMRNFIVKEIHKLGHYGLEKLNDLVRRRFYWPRMYQYISNFVHECDICGRCKADNPTPKAPLIPIREPQSPLEFISIDIAHLPTTKNGLKGILLVGDIFSKYVEAIPISDFSADTVVEAIWTGWITRLGCPLYLHSDQGSNVDGETVRKICRKFNIKKRRTSGYHSEGNGFAERNIRSIRELLRTLLLDFDVSQNQWAKILPSTVFALNTSLSSSTKFTPYEIIFGRRPVLPIDIILGSTEEFNNASTPEEYLSDLRLQLKDIIVKVHENLNVSRERMMKQYNKGILFNDYKPDDKVWLKKKCFKPGESTKLAPRKTGPWTVIRKLPNGVNFEVQNDKSKLHKVVHHNRLSPVTKTVGVKRQSTRCIPPNIPDYIVTDDSTDSSEAEDFNNPSAHNADSNDDIIPPPPRYPRRNRTNRNIEGAIPWDALPNI